MIPVIKNETRRVTSYLNDRQIKCAQVGIEICMQYYPLKLHLEQVLTKEEPGLWPKLSPNMQSIVKQQLLEGIKGEKIQSIRKKVCYPSRHAHSEFTCT